MPLVVFVATFVEVSTLPGELTHAVFLIIFVLSLVHVAVLCIESLSPFAPSVLEPILEFSDVNASILPLVLSLPLWLTVAICT